MNKVFSILILLLVVLFSKLSLSQRFLGAVSAGMNLSQVDGDEKYGFKKVGLNIGPSVIMPFGKNKNWSVTMEILFSQLGSYQRSQYANDTIVDTVTNDYPDGYKLVLNYVQVPVIVHFTDKHIVAAGVGFLYGQLVGAKEWKDFNDVRGMFRTETDLQGPYNLSDFQILADVRLRLWQRLWLDVRYSYSIVPIRTNVEFKNPVTNTIETRNQYNNVICMRLTYIFNEPLEKAAKKKSGSSH